jgi:hypothetical protein
MSPPGWKTLVAHLRAGLSAAEADEMQALLADLGEERAGWLQTGSGEAGFLTPSLGSLAGADAARLWQELDGEVTFDIAALTEAGGRAQLTAPRLVAAVLTLGAVGLLGADG